MSKRKDTSNEDRVRHLKLNPNDRAAYQPGMKHGATFPTPDPTPPGTGRSLKKKNRNRK